MDTSHNHTPISHRSSKNKDAHLNIRIDPALKAEAEELFSSLGFSFSTVFTAFVKQAVREQGLPFKPTLYHTPTAETLAAMEETERIIKDKSAKGFRDMAELKAYLESDND